MLLLISRETRLPRATCFTWTLPQRSEQDPVHCDVRVLSGINPGRCESICRLSAVGPDGIWKLFAPLYQDQVEVLW